MKLTKRKGFNFFRSYYDVYNELSDKDKVAFMNALLDRQFQGVKPDSLTGMAKFAYISQTNSIDSQVKGYEDKTKTKLTPNDGATIPPTDGGQLPPTEQVEVQVEVEGEEKEKVKGEIRLTEVKTSDVPLNEVEFYEIALNIQKKIISNILEAGGSTKKIEGAIYKTWVDPIRLMMSVDGVTREQINKAARFGLQDSFWKTNILTTAGFRKHFDKLILDSNGTKKGQSINERYSKEFQDELKDQLNKFNSAINTQ